MANLFRMKWIKGGAHYGKLNVYQPVIDYDITGPVNIVTNEYRNWDDASNDFRNKSYGIYPEGCPYDVSVGAHTFQVGSRGYDAFFPSVRENIINMGEITAGDRFIMSNGSYWLVTQGPTQSGTYINMTLEGHLSTGEIAYSGIVWSCSIFGAGGVNAQCETFPWLLYHNPQYIIRTISAIAWGNSQTCNYNNGTNTYSPVSATLGGRFWDGLEPNDEDDPYPDTPDSEPDDGGEGVDPVPDPDGGGDDIPIPDIPDISVTDSGFVSLYNPTMSQINDLASFMWSGLFDLNTYKKLFTDPMECILGLNILPIAIPAGPSEYVKVGNITTNVLMSPVQSQFVRRSCGELDIGPILDNYMDFAPYTKWSIYLPYIGIQSLSADDVAHKKISVEYIIDVLTCACIAFVKAGNHVLYQFAGTCGYSVPITSESFSRVIGNLAQLAVTVGGAVATGGASAPLNIGAVASTVNNLTGNKPDVHRSGAIGGSAGIMAIQTPYLIIEYPNICKPTSQPKYMGYPSFITRKVKDVSGYVEFESIVLDTLTCTDAEKDMILEILKGGCYV